MKTTIRCVFQNGILILCNCSRYGGRQQRVRRTSYNTYYNPNNVNTIASFRKHNSIIPQSLIQHTINEKYY